MKRAIKIALITLGSLVGLAAAAIAVLALTLDPNDYRDDIERLVERRSGRDLTIAGPIELSLFPWVGAETGKVTLGNAPGFGPKPFARVRSADLRVRLWPLLWGEITLGQVVLHGAEVNLARDAQGRSNWADLTAEADTESDPPSASSGPAPKPSPQAGGSPDGTLAGITVTGLKLRDTRISWRDATSGAHYRATGLDLTTGALRMGQPFPVSATSRLISDRPELQGTLSLEAQATIDPAANRYALEDTRLETDLAGPALPAGELTATLSGNFASDLAAGTAMVDRLDLRVYGARVESNLNLEGIRSAATVAGQTKVTVHDGEKLAPLLGDTVPAQAWEAESLTGSYLKGRLSGGLGPEGLALENLEGSLLGLALSGRAELRLPKSGNVLSSKLAARVTDGRRLLGPLSDQFSADLRPAALNGARLNLEAQWDKGAGTAELTQLDLEAVGAHLQADASARDLSTEPKASGRLRLAPFSPRRALRALGLPVPETTDSDALEEAALGTEFAADTEGARLTDLTATLDDSRLTGTVGVPDFAGPRVRFDLTLNGMDVDRYLPPPADDDKAAPPASPGAAATAGASQLPLDRLRSLAINGDLTIGRLRLRGLRVSDLKARVAGSDGRFRIHPLNARLYQGRYRGNVRLDARGDTPEVTLDERLSGIQVGPLLADLTGKAPVTGTADVTADLSFRGLSSKAALASLDGKGRYTLRQGSIAGINLERALTQAYAALGGTDGGNRSTGTRFEELEGSATVTGGKIRSDDLSLRSGVVDADGRGFVDLAEARIDYRLEAVVGEDTGAAIKELQGLTVPLRIQGPVSDPSVTVDLKQVLRQRTEKNLEQEKEKAEDRLEQELEEEKDELKEKAKDLLNF